VGINFFETANRYGSEPGEPETIIGNWFASGGGRRERTIIATKVYGEMGDWPNEGKLSALSIRRALDASLRRLQTDYVDLYQFHHIDRNTPWEEIWQAIEVAVQAGQILYAAVATSPAGSARRRASPSIGKSRRTRTWQKSLAWNPERWPWRGCSPGHRSPHRSSAREPVTSWTAAVELSTASQITRQKWPAAAAS